MLANGKTQTVQIAPPVADACLGNVDRSRASIGHA